MTPRLSIAAATAALAALPLLTACSGGSSQPASSAPPTSQGVPSASNEPASTPSTAPTPAFDKAKESKAVTDATEKFAGAFLTLSYKDTSFDDYLERFRPLTTDKGYAEVKREVKKSDFDKILRTLKPARGRTVSSTKGDVKIVEVKPESAATTFKFEVKFQQQNDGGWKTLRTSPAEPGRIDFVKQDGAWLVNDLPAI